MRNADMSVVILCGGLGTRAYPYTRRVPKALMPVDDVPIVEQVMRIYASFGCRDFLLSVGYLKEQIIEYAARLAPAHGWSVRCIDTGESTDTGGRILGCRDYVTRTFHATYCDGLGNVDLDALLAFHGSHGSAATMTAFPMRSQYGLVYANERGRVTHFDEKPVLEDKLINAGFFVFDDSVFESWDGSNLERDVLPALASRDQLFIYRHTGFWRSMDTLKDQQELTRAWHQHSRALSDAESLQTGAAQAARLVT
jgi:glucose-1-phosphate cytidylyltransferase